MYYNRMVYQRGNYGGQIETADCSTEQELGNYDESLLRDAHKICELSGTLCFDCPYMDCFWSAQKVKTKHDKEKGIIRKRYRRKIGEY